MDIDGFQTTDSFRFDARFSNSLLTNSSSSSSGYGSRSSLLSKDFSNGLRRYFWKKLLRRKHCSSSFSSTSESDPIPIYDDIWNLDEQIEKYQRSSIDGDQSLLSIPADSTSVKLQWADEKQILSAAAWYKERMSAAIAEDHLMASTKPIGTFVIHQDRSKLVLSVKVNESAIKHYQIEQDVGYRFQGASKTFVNLSGLVIHHTVIPENLPVLLVLPQICSCPLNSPRLVRSVRF